MSDADNSLAKDSNDKRPNSVFLVPYPKLIFMYPTLVMSLIAAIVMTFVPEPLAADNSTAVVVTTVFLFVLGVNLVVISFDFPRTTSLTLFFLISALIMGVILISVLRPEWLRSWAELFKRLHPLANATFYYIFSTVMLVLYAMMFLSVRFDYWEVRPNELLHHHGMLSDLKRFSAPELRVDKEVNDVFEYFLLRSGRLILHPSGETRSIILENVPFISRKEEALTRMLGALQVQVRKPE